MARSSFISHTVNGYSRYDVPESKAFTCTPGILYPVRIDFINARDRITIAQGIDVRSNPLAVPSFNPYTVRLHRFWVPLQLYHPEMRVNSSKFDMNHLSLNWIPSTYSSTDPLAGVYHACFSNSLMAWLRVGCLPLATSLYQAFNEVNLTSNMPVNVWCNADTYLAYWDIVRNYYSFSQWGVYSFAWPASWAYYFGASGDGAVFDYASAQQFFTQRYGNLEFLDAFYESQFYPGSLVSSNNTFNRSNLFLQIIRSDLADSTSHDSDGYPVASVYPTSVAFASSPSTQFSLTSDAANNKTNQLGLFIFAHPMAVVPSNPDRYSRLIPLDISSDVSMSKVQTIPQLAIASRLQEYKDLLGAGGSRFSDWLETFFASKIEHVDRPKLLFSASQTVNVQVVMNQGGFNNFNSGDSTQAPLGQMGGSICFNTQLGRKQSYYFREPGYMIDMLSIRPVYYWTAPRPDYLHYRASDYFNPIYNDIGYQSVLFSNTSESPSAPENAVFSIGNEPCYNEFRSSYDEVLGQISRFGSSFGGSTASYYSYWVQQRQYSVYTQSSYYYPALFVDMSQVNSPFASNLEDNFFVNLSYSVIRKCLVNKTFATRLSNR